MQKLISSELFNVPGLDVLHTTYDVDGHEVSGTVCLGHAPWDDDAELKDKLESAGWRYAVLIGITDAEDAVSPEQAASDKVQYAHLIAPHEGNPNWYSKQATGFVCELTGVSREVAAAWLNLDWFGGGEV